jgi:osmotically-inducible protein OsmY
MRRRPKKRQGKSRLLNFVSLVRLLLLVNESKNASGLVSDTTTDYLKGETIMVAATAARTDTPSDEQIQREVLAELKWDARVQTHEIGVAVKDGVVTLTGWLDSYAKKWAAEEAAHRVRGVKALANDIEIRLPTSAERTDTDIAAAVVRALESDALISIDKLDVTVAKGWVTLKGEVEWQHQKEDAESVVRRLAGVKGVSNVIEVKPRITPSELKEKIEQALIRSAETDAKRITVEINGSKAILRGTVRSWAEKREAARAAWSAPGITTVENRIAIS